MKTLCVEIKKFSDLPEDIQRMKIQNRIEMNGDFFQEEDYQYVIDELIETLNDYGYDCIEKDLTKQGDYYWDLEFVLKAEVDIFKYLRKVGDSDFADWMEEFPDDFWEITLCPTGSRHKRQSSGIDYYPTCDEEFDRYITPENLSAFDDLAERMEDTAIVFMHEAEKQIRRLWDDATSEERAKEDLEEVEYIILPNELFMETITLENAYYDFIERPEKEDCPF